jgi:hypothetical protein
MIAFNVILMIVVIVALASALAWAISSDRRSKRAAGGTVPREEAPLTENLMMPREVRAQRSHSVRIRRKDRSGSTRA